MSQYTTKEQTAKLMELGFERPNASHRYFEGNTLHINNNYSIGELIAFLEKYHFPTHIRVGGVKTNNVINQNHEEFGGELIDLLFNLCVKIKEGEEYVGK